MHGVDSGWTIIAKVVGIPVVLLAFLWLGVRFVFWALERGFEYRREAQGFVGVGPMIGLNLLLPGTGLMAGGFPMQGWLCLGIWALVLVTGLRYASLINRNLTVIHLFAGVWASVVASREAAAVVDRRAQDRRREVVKVNLQKQRVPTMEDPDLYVTRLECFQLVLEAAADPRGRFDRIQTAAVNRLKGLLRIEERTFAKLLEQLQVHGDARTTLGEGSRLGGIRVFERVLPRAVDHPAFEGLRDPFLETAASLLGVPATEARARRRAYENGEEFTSDEDEDLGLSETSASAGEIETGDDVTLVDPGLPSRSISAVRDPEDGRNED